MTTDKGKYNIKAVSNMLGISPGTLRAWERRYQVIAPTRSESGHRLYTDEQVEILRKVVAKVNEGLTIRQAVALLEDEPKSKSPSYDWTTDVMDELFQSFVAFDEPRVHALLNYLFSIYTVEKTVVDLFPSLLLHIRNWRNEKKMTSVHESFARSILRSKIGMIFLNIPIASPFPTAISILGPNETDELTLLIFTVYLRLKGFRVIYVGGTVSKYDFLAMLDDVKPTFLFSSCTDFKHIEKMNEFVRRVSDHAPYVTVGLIGEAAAAHPLYIGNTKAEWEKWFEQNVAEQKLHI
jgi:MerR family transcriptional regulator, light-induced transcriptional regulator